MNTNKLLETYAQDDIIYLGPTGSRLIKIEDPRDYDFIVLVKEQKGNQRIIIDRSQEMHIEFYTDTIEEITKAIFGLSQRSLIGGIACLCSIPDEIYKTLNLDLDLLNSSVRERISKIFKPHIILNKHIYYLPLIKHVLETNNHNYTDEEIKFAQKLYYKTELDEECREIFEYFNLEMY